MTKVTRAKVEAYSKATTFTTDGKNIVALYQNGNRKSWEVYGEYSKERKVNCARGQKVTKTVWFTDWHKVTKAEVAEILEGYGLMIDEFVAIANGDYEVEENQQVELNFDNAVEEIDASEYAVSVEAQEIAILAEIQNQIIASENVAKVAEEERQKKAKADAKAAELQAQKTSAKAKLEAAKQNLNYWETEAQRVQAILQSETESSQIEFGKKLLESATQKVIEAKIYADKCSAEYNALTVDEESDSAVDAEIENAEKAQESVKVDEPKLIEEKSAELKEVDTVAKVKVSKADLEAYNEAKHNYFSVATIKGDKSKWYCGNLTLNYRITKATADKELKEKYGLSVEKFSAIANGNVILEENTDTAAVEIDDKESEKAESALIALIDQYIIKLDEDEQAEIEEINAQAVEKKFYVIGYHYYDYFNGCSPAYCQVLNKHFVDFGDAVNYAKTFIADMDDKMIGDVAEDYTVYVTDKNIDWSSDDVTGTKFYNVAVGYWEDAANNNIERYKDVRVFGDNEVYDEEQFGISKAQENLLYELAQKFGAKTKINFNYIKPYESEKVSKKYNSEIEQVKEPTLIDKLRAKVAEQKNESRKSIIDWNATFADMKLEKQLEDETKKLASIKAEIKDRQQVLKDAIHNAVGNDKVYWKYAEKAKKQVSGWLKLYRDCVKNLANYRTQFAA